MRYDEIKSFLAGQIELAAAECPKKEGTFYASVALTVYHNTEVFRCVLVPGFCTHDFSAPTFEDARSKMTTALGPDAMKRKVEQLREEAARIEAALAGAPAQ